MKASRSVDIIDDEAEVRDALTLLLSTAQIESRSYGSAEEYLTLNPLNEPACILLDNQLPGMSGIELLRQIVAATKDSTVIMITAYGDVPTAVSAMRAGAFHFVQKPFDAEVLLATVEEALSRTGETRDDPHEIRFCASSSANGGHGWRSGGLAELGFLVLFEIVHVEVAVGLEPVLMGFDG